MTGFSSRRGVTLVELMVVLVLLALVSGVAVVAMRAPGSATRPVSVAEATIARARGEALATARPVSVRVAGTVATALPDGSVVTEATVGGSPVADSAAAPAIDRLSGRVRHASR